jgi:hypothetical protein
MVDIKLNSACQRDIQFIGDERTPVITIDDLLLSTDELVEYASRHARFSSDGQLAYPGIRADLPAEYANVLAPELVALISNLYNTPRSYDYRLVHQLFSLVTEAPENLGPLQRMPHTDNRSPYYFATVHYLNTVEHAGTGFFRHRPTSYERITEGRYQAYIQAANTHMQANGLPAQKYINASDDHFELIGEVEYRPNRIVIYPSNLLHSGLIQPDRDIDKDPGSGRLTANLFFYFGERPRTT